MAVTTVTFNTAGNVLPLAGSTKNKRTKMRDLARLALNFAAGTFRNPGSYTNTARVGNVAASTTVTAATAVATNTVTINGVALTCAQLHAQATAIFATIVNGNVLTVNGTAFTAKTSADAASQVEFALGANDTAAVVNCVAKINAHPAMAGIITATADNATGDKTVKLRADSYGTAGNAYTLTATGVPITVSGATFGDGAAPSGNQFDPGHTNAQCATSLAACINRSATTLVVNMVTAAAAAAVCTITAVSKGLLGNAMTIASSGATVAVPGARFTGGTETLYTF
jgi:hypothetical protein